ncbi:hypothetical protein [Actinoplanes sp. DH11]|uniref:hypothetical protein n=1 Tax=Actinoplanes sp. DH11 TaxID=2857011 RepID=UPI001E40A8C3|nr:hypothetical protein [Actinoplanes sp. DH11]
MAEDWTTALHRYAQRLHTAAGDRHHIASPLGAWLLLALTASSGPAGELADPLGVEPAEAARIAGELLARPHPLVAAATAVWHAGSAGLGDWPAALPEATEVGPLPDKESLDRWAREHTYGMIEEFPGEPAADLLLLLASALATKVSWIDPFEVAPAGRLGGAWADRLGTVLWSPEYGHAAFVAGTAAAGDVIVHVASADGLHVVSVAAAADVAPDRVLAAAHEIAPAVVTETGTPPAAKSLFDLPLGETPLWTISEERGHESRREFVRALLPAWSATTEHDLAADPALGFPAATRVLARLLRRPEPRFEAKQTATARFSRFGFEAAAVSGYFFPTSLPPEQVIRRAELRFAHPYAVVAVTAQPGGPWHGVPVFSAWVRDPEDVAAADLTDGDHDG